MEVDIASSNVATRWWLCSVTVVTRCGFYLRVANAGAVVKFS
jgi:hypothetical protein